MDKKIKDCLCGNTGDYILPFLWLHGEPKERIYEEIIAIKNSGINEFCAESRPYEEFCKAQWWDDFEFILKTASEFGMRVWLLDDKKFPTGYANGYLEMPEHANLRKRLIRETQIEAIGPMMGAKLFVGGQIRAEERILQVIAYRHSESDEGLDYRSAVDLTGKLEGDMVYWDIPKGLWRVCVTIESAPYEYENDRLFYYIDMLNKDSCHAMIDAIYEPHYEHFAKYFGNTFAGFFSDEPAFLNVCYTYYNMVGNMGSPFPWRNDLPELIAKNSGLDLELVRLSIPALWEELGDITPVIRTAYMDTITRLYSENFSYQLGNWCREHGVMYIGHVIEDMGAHMRLGYGSGHFFRALDGQDMAGIDVVLHQDIPGIYDNVHRAPLADGGKADPAFFHYTLPKLGSSHSHIQPLKKGRAMCEIFGAFGWAEGLPFMKGLADTMLVSGINYFVPHAFSPKEEDTDCPPHFYNGGKNIQYPLFKDLMGYMSRCSHMLSDATHVCDVAVFYNAEAEWSTKNHKSINEICKLLTQNQIDFDIVPYDALLKSEVSNKRLKINGESYGALIVPGCEFLPKQVLSLLDKLALCDLPVILTDYLPNDSTTSLVKLPLDCIASTLRKKGLCHVYAEGDGTRTLKFYHATRNERDIYLFSCEGVGSFVDATITLKQSGECLIYEPWSNKCYRTFANDGKLKLHLDGGNMLFAIFGEEIPCGTPEFKIEADRAPLPLRFDIAIKEEGKESFTTIAEGSECFDISAPNNYPEFSGYIKYNATFDSKDGFNTIDLGQVGEVAQAWLNGVYLGARINAPYKFDMTSAMKQGANDIEIIVTSNLAHKRHDDLSRFIQIPPSGIIGDISLCKYEK